MIEACARAVSPEVEMILIALGVIVWCAVGYLFGAMVTDMRWRKIANDAAAARMTLFTGRDWS